MDELFVALRKIAPLLRLGMVAIGMNCRVAAVGLTRESYF
jgi:hypothetical protein